MFDIKIADIELKLSLVTASDELLLILIMSLKLIYNNIRYNRYRTTYKYIIIYSNTLHLFNYTF